jgi:hypothetical protein
MYQQVAASKENRSDDDVQPIGKIKFRIVLSPGKALREYKIEYPEHQVQYQKNDTAGSYCSKVI